MRQDISYLNISSTLIAYDLSYSTLIVSLALMLYTPVYSHNLPRRSLAANLARPNGSHYMPLPVCPDSVISGLAVHIPPVR